MSKVSNLKLAQYVALKQQEKSIKSQLEALRSEIEACGDFETREFSVRVNQYETNRACGCDELLEKVGFLEVNRLGLIKTTIATRLTVERKERISA